MHKSRLKNVIDTPSLSEPPPLTRERSRWLLLTVVITITILTFSPISVMSPADRISRSRSSWQALSTVRYLSSRYARLNTTLSRTVAFWIHACWATYATVPCRRYTATGRFVLFQFVGQKQLNVSHVKLTSNTVLYCSMVVLFFSFSSSSFFLYYFFFSSSFSSYSFFYSKYNFLLSKWTIFRLPPVPYDSNSEAWQIDQGRLALTLKVTVKVKVCLGIQSQIKTQGR